MKNYIRALLLSATVLLFLTLHATSSVASPTPVTVAVGHTLSNVRTTLSKSVKYANGHQLSAECVSGPNPGDADRLDIANIAYINATRGIYKFDINAHSTASAGTYVVRFYDATTPQVNGKHRPLPMDLTVEVKTYAVISVSFRGSDSGSLPISILVGPSTARQVEADEWRDGSQNDPGAYIRGSGNHVKVGLHGPPNTSCTVSATGGFGGIANHTISFDSSGVGYATDFAINSFPTFVCKENVFWNWKFTRGGVTSSINTTGHKIYSVLRTQYPGNKFKELYEFGCGWAHGETTHSGTWSKIWGSIATRSAFGYAYYPQSFAGGMPTYFFTNQVIWYHSGRCGAFQNLTRDIANVQGLNVDYVSLFVKKPYVAFATCAPGQGGTPQQQWFKDHGIVSYDSTLYDPSYGTGGFADKQSWANQSIDAHTKVEPEKAKGDACPVPSGDWTAMTDGTEVIDTP